MSGSGGILQRARRLVAPVRPLLYRSRPFSRWGLERGTPIDRFYLERFLALHGPDIRGHVLEVKDSAYTERFGTAVQSADVLDIDPGNASATVVADLATADDLPGESYDCFVLTQTLQYVTDPRRALFHAHRILRPGGVLLLTLPGIIRVEPPARDVDRWRFTETSCRELLGEAFGPEQIEVSSAGNLTAAVAFLFGMASEEISPRRLVRADPDFPVVLLGRAVRRAHRM